MKRNRIILLISGFWLLVSGYYIYAQDETLTLLTYYPAPYGVYRQFRITHDGTANDFVTDTNGNIGIGTNAPLSKLYFVGTNDAVSQVIFMPGNDTAAGGLPYTMIGIGRAPYGILEVFSGGQYSLIRSIAKEDGYPDQTLLELGREQTVPPDEFEDAYLTTVSILTVKESGNVGIGTNVPGSTLVVSDQKTGTSPILALQRWVSGDADTAILFDSPGNKFTIGIDQSDSSKFKISDNNSLGTNDRLTIDATGNVSFTNMPGIAYANSFSINHPSQDSTWSDFTNLTINIPASGYVLVELSGGELHTYNSPIVGNLRLSVGIAEISNGTPPAGASTEISWAGNINFYASYSVSRTYSVSAGSKTFYIVGKVINGPKRLQLSGSIHAIYFPVEYNP